MGHKLLGCDCNDGLGVTCYRCGMHAESIEAAYTVDCGGPDTQHPPYLRKRGVCATCSDHPPYLLADGTYETCAAHPYQDCGNHKPLRPDDGWVE